MSRLARDLRRIAVPRLVGSEGEAQVKDYLRAELEALGLEVNTEPFTFSDFNAHLLPRATAALTALLLAVGGWLYAYQSHWLILPSLALFVLTAVVTQWHLYFEKFMRVGRLRQAENLVAQIPNPKPQTPTLIFMAHYDSKSSTMPTGVRLPLLLLALVATLALCAIFLAASLLPYLPISPPLHFPTPVLSLCAANIALLLFLLLNRTGNNSPGAFDNAAGVAAVLETARRLQEDPPQNVDVWFVLTSAEEFGLCGAVAFLEGRPLDRARTFLLNVDTPCTARGNLYFNSSFGIPPLRLSASLNHLLLASAEEQGIRLHPLYMPLGVAADHVPFARRGYQAACLVAPVLFIHSPGDAPERVPIEAVEKVVRVCLGVATGLSKRVDKCSP